MSEKLPTSSFAFWLDQALSGWIVPGAAVALLAAAGAAYLAGFATEATTATLVVGAVAIAVSALLARPALDARRDRAGRALAGAAALATLVAVALPAWRTVNPGTPLLAGDLAGVDGAVPIPEGVSGPVRLLVSGRLPERGEPSVQFTLSGTAEPVDGKLERTYGYARVGRGGRARVAHDHTADFYSAEVPRGARALKLERLDGRLGSPLHVAAFRPPLPLPWGAWALAGVAVLLAAAADARLGGRNELAVPAGMAVAFGLLVTFNATPAAAVGPAVGGVVLGALVGALAGWLVGLVVRRLVPAPATRPPPERRRGGAAVA